MNTRFTEVILSKLLCGSCGHRWELNGYAYRTKSTIPWIMAKKTVQACPVCDEKNNLKVIQLNWE